MAKQQDRLYKRVEKRYEYSKDSLDSFHSEWKELEDLYWNQLDDKSPWKSQVFDPIAFEVVERMVSHAFAGNPKGRFVPREAGDEEGAMVADELYKYQWDHPYQSMRAKLERQGRSVAVFGTSFGTLHWRYETKNIKKGDEEITQTVWDAPIFKDLYIYDCFPDPDATDISTMQWFIHNDYVTLEDLKATNSIGNTGEKRYRNLGRLEEAIKGNKQEATEESERQHVDQIRQSNTNSSGKKDRILVRRMYTRKKWITIAPDYKLVIEDRENPYEHGDLPIHMIVNYQYPNQLLGRGEIEPIKPLQKASNSVLNQRLDNVRLILSPPMKVTPNNQYVHTWKWRPMQRWVMNNTSDAELFNIPDTTSGTFIQTTNYFKDSVARTLGHHDILTRNETSQDRTATEVKAAVGEQNARMRLKTFAVDDFIVRLAGQWMQLNQQFLTSPKLVRIVGADNIRDLEDRFAQEQVIDPENGTELGIPRMTIGPNGNDVQKFTKDGDIAFLTVTPDDIMGQYDYVVESGGLSSVDPSSELQTLSLAIKMTKELEPSLKEEGVRINYQPLLQKAYKHMGIKNTDEIFEAMSDQEMQQNMVSQQRATPIIQ